ALEELKRVGGFERSVLIVVTPTGTGWVDPAAIDSVEYLHNGAVASVALQYSYLASWLSLLVEPGYGAGAARALFNEIYGYWITLPNDSRPRLYLHGLSLGAKLRTVDGPDRSAWRSILRRTVERPALFKQALAFPYRPSQSRIARLASPVPRRIVRALHEPA